MMRVELQPKCLIDKVDVIERKQTLSLLFPLSFLSLLLRIGYQRTGEASETVYGVVCSGGRVAQLVCDVTRRSEDRD